jgi:hypothetical protein
MASDAWPWLTVLAVPSRAHLSRHAMGLSGPGRGALSPFPFTSSLFTLYERYASLRWPILRMMTSSLRRARL